MDGPLVLKEASQVNQWKLTFVLAVLGSPLAASYGAPVLLATVTNEYSPYLDIAVESEEVNNVFRMMVSDNYDSYNLWLFRDDSVTVVVNTPAISIHQSANRMTDSDFDLIAQLLTDGVSSRDSTQGEFIRQDLVAIGILGDESILDILVPRFSEYDLLGYDLERIDRHLTYEMISPGRDLNGDGEWTDFYFSGTYEFWGTVVPEPATFCLLCVGLLPLLHRKRSRV